MKNIVLPPFLKKKFFWQTLLGFMFLVVIIYFIRNERVELAKMRPILAEAKGYYLLAGILVSFVVIFFQALLYVWSFKSLGKKLSLFSAARLFLKRNVIGVLIPGGTFSSLAFFNSDLDKYRISKTQQYIGSYIFGMASTVSIIVIAIPGFIILAARGQLNGLELVGFVLISIIIVILTWGFYTLVRSDKGFLYRILHRYKPNWLVILEEFSNQHVSFKKILQTCLISVCIELFGVLHLYLALKALNATPLLSVALTGYVVMIIVMSFSPFIKGLGAVELSLTFLLVQFGYETSLAASITLIFRFFEFWLPLGIGLLVFVIRKENFLLRLIPAILLLVSGIVNVVSVLTPAIPERLAFINDLIPSGLVDLSNLSILYIGIIIIILSWHLFLGSRNAWKTALALTLVSVAGHLVKALDYEEALVSFVVFLSLLYTRKSYFRKQGIPIELKSLKKVSLFVSLYVIYGIVGFYLLDKVHFKKDLALVESIKMFLECFTGQHSYQPMTHFGREFIHSVQIAGAGIFVYVLWVFLGLSRKQKTQPSEDRQLAKGLVAKYGNSRLDYFKVYLDKKYFFNKTNSGFISYKMTDSYAVVLENPVCENKQDRKELVKSFRAYSRTNGNGLFFYRIPEDSVDMYKKLGFKAILLGQEAIVDLNTFSMVGGEKSSLRNSINKIKKSGYVTKIYEPPLKDGLIQKLENVSDEWLAEHKMNEVAFTQGVFDRKEIKDTSVITLENVEEEVLVFANLIPETNKTEGTYDLIRRAEDAPNGSVDFLLIEMFDYFKSMGYSSFNLGMAALSGFEKGHTLKQRAIYYITEIIRNNSRFKGLHDFKEKFDPGWKNTYLVYQNSYDLLRFPIVLNKVSKYS
ncbi:MAG: phosphatidylglycerol lysyltransferase domain-containing protein [Bacteroidota bacterium]